MDDRVELSVVNPVLYESLCAIWVFKRSAWYNEGHRVAQRKALGPVIIMQAVEVCHLVVSDQGPADFGRCGGFPGDQTVEQHACAGAPAHRSHASWALAYDAEAA